MVRPFSPGWGTDDHTQGLRALAVALKPHHTRNLKPMFTAERIKNQNTLNGVANEIEGHLIQILSPYQVLKVLKISGYGGYVAKLRSEFQRYDADHGYNQPGQPYWLNVYASGTSLMATVRDITNTAKPVDMYLGRFNDQTGVMTHLSECTKRRTDYTLAEVEEALARASRLEEEARQLRSSVSAITR